MNKIFQLLSIIVYGVIIFLFGWFISYLINQYVISASILILLLLLIIKYISSLSIKKIYFWSLIISPTVFLISSFLFYLFLNNEIIQRFFWLVVAIIITVFLYHIWLYYHKPVKYQAFTLENFSWYLNLLSSFFVISGIFGLITFVNFKLYLAFICIIIFSALIFYQIWWIEKLEVKKIIFFESLSILIALEIFFSLQVLPFNFYLLAFWWTGVWYIISKIFIKIAKGDLVFKKIIKQSIIVLIISVLLTVTTRWF